MNDSFQYGKPAKRGPQVNASPKLLIGLVMLAVAAVAVFFAMKTFSGAGKEAAQAEVSVIQQADVAQDITAKTNLSAALAAAQIAAVQSNSFVDAGPAQLAAVEPTFQYTDGPSTAPSVISVSATETQWSAAAMAESGTCFWIALGPSGTTYGSGTPCTGAAAAGASAASW
jgi:hypothetical protein